MRFTEILAESITFSVARLEDRDGRQWYINPFERKVMEPCWVCDGTGLETHREYTDDDGRVIPETKFECGMCKGEKKIESWKSDADELNVANGNGLEIQRMLGLDPDYSGAIKKEDFPQMRRRLIRIKNGDMSPHIEEPTKTVGKMRASTDDTGQTSIGRGATMYDAGRSHSQVERYIDRLLSMMDFAQKNDCDLVWS
jgi:hypothetical protein